MSKVSLAGNASGTGIFTIASPNSNTDRTLTLPDNTGTLLSSSAQGIPRSALPAGSVLQVVSANNTTDTSVTTTTPTSIVTASITPTSSTSKILVIYNWNSIFKNDSSEGEWRLYVNGSALQTVDGITPYNAASGYLSCGSVAGSYLHSPATTSSTTYGMYLNSNGSGTVRINTEGGCTTITLMEIAA